LTDLDFRFRIQLIKLVAKKAKNQKAKQMKRNAIQWEKINQGECYRPRPNSIL